MKKSFDENPILNALWYGFTIGVIAGVGFTMVMLGGASAAEVLGFHVSKADWYTAGFYFVSGLIVMFGSIALASRVGRQLLKPSEAVDDDAQEG